MVDPESALYKQALAEEAAVLGIALPQERYLMPIAEEALLAEPPSPWKELVDPDSGSPYYLNTVTNESTWDNPALAALKQRVHAARQQHVMQQQQQRQFESPPLAPPAPSPRGLPASVVASPDAASAPPPASPQHLPAQHSSSSSASSASSPSSSSSLLQPTPVVDMSAKPKSSPPPPVADEDCVEYIVSRRPDKNSSTGELEYKVHWTGTDITEDEWFLRGALVNDYPDMLTAYDRKEDDRLAKKRADAAKASQAAKAAKAAELAKAAESKRRQRAEESRKVLTKLNGEVERLENEADGLRRDLFDVREDRDSLARKVKRLRTDYEQAESHIARLKGELATESDDTAKLRHKVRALQSDCAKLEREQSKMTAAAEIAARDMQESRDAETVAHSANQTALAEATEAHARALRRAEERAARAEEALRKEVAARVERMRALDASEQSLDKIRGVLVEEEQKVSALQARLTVVEEEHQNSQRRAGAQATEIAQAQARVAELEAEAANAAAAVQATAKETPPPAPAAPVPAVAPALPPKLAEEAADSLRAKVSAQVREQCEAEFTRALESREKTHADEKVQLAARHQEALRHLTSANEEKLAALATAEKKLAERARERARAESQAAAAADAEQSRLKSEELAEKVSKLKKTNAALKGLLEDAQLEMEQRSGRVSALEALLQEAKEKESAEVEKMQRKMDVFEAELSRETEARIEKHAEAARAEAKASIDRIQRKLEAVQEKFRSEVATRRKLHERVMELEGNIRVFCRSRPVLAVDGSGEYAQVVVSCATVDGEVAERIDEAAGPLKVLRLKFDEVATTRRVDAEFEFESVFPKGVQQTDVYEKIRPFVISAVDGYDVCLFAYGQTGSGKTFTMEGGGTRDYGSVDAQKVQTDDGIYARALETMFDEARSRAQACGTMAYEFQISMTEIYMEEVFDLLKASEGDGGGSATGKTGKKNKVELRQKRGGGVYAEGLTRVRVHSSRDVRSVMELGAKSRSVGSHNMNERSSRSHLVVTVTIIARSTKGSPGAGSGEDGEDDLGGAAGAAAFCKKDGTPPETGRGQRVSRIHMIDLAGSERVGMTNASGHRLKEAQAINKSLSALGNVICALGRSGDAGAKGHIPFRDSKLTHLLSESLSGTSKVIMMLCISPTAVCGPETLCSLKFAARCRATKLGRARKKAMKKGGGGAGRR